MLRAHVAAGQLTLDGPVNDANEKKAIESAAADRFGKDNVLRPAAGAGRPPTPPRGSPTAMPALPRKGAGFGAIDVDLDQDSADGAGAACRPRRRATRCVKAVDDAVRPQGGRQAPDRRRGRRRHAAEANIDDAVEGRTIAFESGSAAITKAGQKVLHALVKPLKAAGSERVVVGGYTDNVGDAKANLRLSKARAHSVVVFLTKHGVAAKTLIAKGYGETKPIATNKTAAGRSKNRRIEFTVLSG